MKEMTTQHQLVDVRIEDTKNLYKNKKSREFVIINTSADQKKFL